MMEAPRNIDDWSDYLHPLLLKELRQGLRSSEFLVSFYGIHAVSVVLVFASFIYDSNPQVISIFGWGAILFFLLNGSGRKSALIHFERKENTLDLLLSTGLGPRRIIVGKWATAVALSLLYAISIIPYAIIHSVISGDDLLADLAGMFELLLLNCVVQASSLVFSSLIGFWVRHGFIVYLVGASTGIGAVSLYGMRLLGLHIDFYGILYLTLCTVIAAPLLTISILQMHGSMLPARRVYKKKLEFQDFFRFAQVRSHLDLNDRFNAYLVKELRQRLRSGDYPLLLVGFQLLMLYAIRQYPEMFWIICSLLFLLFINGRQLHPIETERRTHTLEPILLTQITGQMVVSAALGTAVIDELILIVGVLPWVIFRSLFLKQSFLLDLQVLVALVAVSIPLVAFATAVNAENRIRYFFAVATLGLIPVLVALADIGLFTSPYATLINYRFDEIVLCFVSALITKYILSCRWKLRQY